MATDPLDDMPRIRLEKDDLESFHRTRAQSSNKSSKKSNLPDKSTNKSNSPSWFAFLFLLIIVVSASSYWSFEQYKALQQAQNRITDLESRLSATGENMDQSAAALQIKVSELLNKTVMAVKASSEKSIRTVSSETTDNNTIIGLVKEQLENQANLLKQLNDKLGQSNNVDANFEQQIASLREKLISTALINNNLTNQVDVLRRRVSVTEKKANEIKILPTPKITPIQ
jgi:hypothetical protein